MKLTRSRPIWIPGLLLLAGSALLFYSITPVQGGPRVLAMLQDEPNKPPDEDPASPAEFLWQRPDPSLIQDEPLQVTVPKGLPPLAPKSVVPVSNPITKGKFELGRQLYFDPRISLDGTVSCATCHNPDKGWSDGGKTATGIDGQRGNRNSPTVFNTAYGKNMFWDGRSPSLEGQAQGPMVNPIEMGEQKHEDVVKRLRRIPAYREQFRKVFGTDVTLDGMAKAIATFERVAALSGNSKYDRYINGEYDALSESEKRGMVLFGLRLDPEDEYEPTVELQKAKCTLCHVGANFSDEEFHNLGVGWDEAKKKHADPGRWAPEPIGNKTDLSLGSFKTPTVRNAELTGPYMHDGSMKTLEEVMDHYNKGGTPNPSLDKDMVPLKLTPEEVADVIAFMKALTGEVKTTAELIPNKLPPGPDGSTPDPVAALTPPGT
ncbi:cytochrome-c peroxidase [Paludisphaera soli]|uniref:cytochrome-c peroxidase n=1 Tax=Paludisphaera soli TaxID=2712865 RepID=UPI001F0EB4B2|nr:cytochrome c peroxidase [Paludisphaera soli]